MKFRRIISACAGAAVIGNFLAGMPLAAFAAETTEYSFTYENYTVSYNIIDSWGQGEQVSVTISNTGDSTIENWMLVYEDFSASIGDIWNAAVVETAPGMFYIRNSGYNANIEPNGSVSFGCVLSGDDPVPGDILMQQARVAKAAEDYDVSLHIKDDWGPAFNADIMLRNNTDQPLEWWELDFNTNFTVSQITSSWAAVSTQLGEDSYRFKGTYNGIIPPQTEIALGFSGVKNADRDTPEITAEGLTEVIFGGYPQHIDIEAERQAEREYVESLNENAEYPVEFSFNPDGTANSIDGKFSEIDVTDGASAQESLNQIGYLIGTADSDAVLVFDGAYSNDATDYTIYYFHEEFRGLPVLDGSVAIVARNSGETVSLSSGFTNIPSDFSTVPAIPAAQIAAQYPDSTVTLAILPAIKSDETTQLVYVCSGSDGDLVVSATNAEVLLNRSNVTEDEEPAEPASVQMYDPDPQNNEIYRDGDLVYCRGTFGTVLRDGPVTPSVQLNNDELNALKINDPAITFRYASLSEAYFYQTLSRDEYQSYLDANKKLSVVEWETNYVKVDVAANEYHFDQMYNGIQVYGRVLTETVNDEGDTFIMDSNVLSAEELADAFSGISAKADASIESVKLANPALADLNAERPDPVLYTWESFEADPALVYIFLDPANNRTYLVSAENGNYGTILNADDDSYQLGKGLDEGSNTRARTLQYFPLVTADDTPNVIGFSYDFGDCIGTLAVRQKVRYFSGDFPKIDSPVLSSANTYFYEPEAVASYLNVRRAYDFYVEKFGHHFDQNGKNHSNFTLYINYKAKTTPGAAASAGSGEMNFFPRNDKFCSTASNKPCTVAHEYTHTIFHAFNRGIPSQGYMYRGINEAYAFVMGYSIYTDFTENYGIYTSDPDFPVDFSESKLDDLVAKGDTTIDGHTISKFMYGPARLMREAGMSADEIGQVLYHSIILGNYTRNSTLNSMRVNIIKACKVLHYTEDQLAVVREALDSIWKHDYREFFATFNIRDDEHYSTAVSNVTVKLFKEGTADYLEPISTGDFDYKYKIEAGEYYCLEVSAPGFLTYRNKIHMYFSENAHQVRLLPIHYDSMYQVKDGKARILAKDKITDQPSAATLFLKTYDENFNLVPVTDADGNRIEISTNAETGLTEIFTFKPGYYIPRAVGADNIFVQPMMQIPSGNEEVEHLHVFYDTRMNGGPRSYFSSVHVDEFAEVETAFNAFNSLEIISDATVYSSSSGLSQFGRGKFIMFYDPDTATDYQVVFKPTAWQISQLEDILISEGNMQVDYETGERKFGHMDWTNDVWSVEPSANTYYNIVVSAGFDTRSTPENQITAPTLTITAYQLYKGLMENNGVYTLYTIHANGTGVLTMDPIPD